MFSFCLLLFHRVILSWSRYEQSRTGVVLTLVRDSDGFDAMLCGLGALGWVALTSIGLDIANEQTLDFGQHSKN